MAREIMNWANRGNVFYAEFNKPDVIIKQYEDTAKLTHVSIRINLKDSKISYGISGAIKQLDFSIPLNKDTEVIGK